LSLVAAQHGRLPLAVVADRPSDSSSVFRPPAVESLGVRLAGTEPGSHLALPRSTGVSAFRNPNMRTARPPPTDHGGHRRSPLRSHFSSSTLVRVPGAVLSSARTGVPLKVGVTRQFAGVTRQFARRNCLELAMTVAGVMFATVLVLVQGGIYLGLVESAATSISPCLGDLWITPEPAQYRPRVRDLPTTLDRVRGTKGVACLGGLADRLLLVDQAPARRTGSRAARRDRACRG
jgi:hypothetical protein